MQTAVHVRRKLKSRGSRRDDSALSVISSSPAATPVASNELDSGERCPMGHSLCPHQHMVLLEWLVQLFVVDTCYVPQTAQRLLALGDLPAALERVAKQAERRLQGWFAWADGPRTRFVVAEMATVPVQLSHGEALRMFFYDEEGRFASCGTWALQSKRSWILCDRR